MDIALGVAVGIGLSAAAGFRAFVPLLFMSIAARTGHLALAPGMEWISTDPALAALATATVLEVLAYYIPWLDHLLDTVATPAAVLAGVLATAAVTPDLPPLLRWAVAIVAGGGAAGLIQGTTVILRLASLALTGGLSNPVVATGELLGAITLALLALLAPLVALMLVAAILVFTLRRGGRFLRRHVRVTS
jgi:hypothetical protein